jgi:hypothetical protein
VGLVVHQSSVEDFATARRRMSCLTVGAMDGLPGQRCWGNVHFRAMSCRCQASSAVGVTAHTWCQRSRGTSQERKRTRGGAHPCKGWTVHPHLEATVPVGRAINPISNTNWEGTGVQPGHPLPRCRLPRPRTRAGPRPADPVRSPPTALHAGLGPLPVAVGASTTDLTEVSPQNPRSQGCRRISRAAQARVCLTDLRQMPHTTRPTHGVCAGQIDFLGGAGGTRTYPGDASHLRLCRRTGHLHPIRSR